MNIAQKDIRDKCIGCGACEASCPKGIIKISPDKTGFYKAEITDTCGCIACGKCAAVCPTLCVPSAENKSGYYGYAKTPEERNRGTSGGIFAALAEKYVKEGGVVFGCVLDIDKKLVCHVSSDESSIAEMSRSKYVQSYTSGVFEKVKKALEENKNVLFCGTPCQVSGLKLFLGKEYDRLLTIDFICHGTPSPRIFKEYLTHLEGKKKLTAYDFRSKKKGWGKMLASYTLNGRVKYKNSMLDPFNYLFEKGLSINPSCYSCNYREGHTADITVGDFWHYAKCGLTKEQVYEGMSLCVANTDKGDKILSSSDVLVSSPIEPDKYSNAFVQRKKKGVLSETFLKEYADNGYDAVIDKYAKNLFIRQVKAKLKVLRG